MTDGETSARQYDAMAAAYAADTSQNACNAFYERPATIALLGEVAGRRVLEAGCGAGALTSWLVERGAQVTAFDISASMLAIARGLVGDRATFIQADLAEPLAFAASGSFDLVVASLVLHYLRDWDPVLTEMRRVLCQDGRVVFSTHHPSMDWQLHSAEDYFAVKQVTETWSKGSQSFEVTFWRRPLTEMCRSISSAGFVIERLVEPEPVAELARRDPADDRRLRTAPGFLFFRLAPSPALGTDDITRG